MSSIRNMKKTRAEVVARLENNYKGQYGKFLWYAGQSFVFKDKNVINKSLLIRRKPDGLFERRTHLFFDIKEVYESDSDKELQKTINDFQNEYRWFRNQFSDGEYVKVPKEEYSIGKDPLGSNNRTVVINVEYIEKIQGDIFRIDPKLLNKYLTEFPEFRNAFINLLQKYYKLGEKDIFTDYIGDDNVVIYLDDNDNPKIAIIDPHIVWYKSKSNDVIRERLDKAHKRIKMFLADPMDMKNIKYLTADGLDS